jgi:hypothetical protein
VNSFKLNVILIAYAQPRAIVLDNENVLSIAYESDYVVALEPNDGTANYA